MGNCIGYYNYRYFLNSLFMISVCSIATFAICLRSYLVIDVYVIQKELMSEFKSIALVIPLSTSSGCSLVITMFFIYHLVMAMKGVTSIEDRMLNQSRNLNV
jgi:hypothetical protein